MWHTKNKNLPDFTVNYTWLSDSAMESMVDFSPGSTTLLENIYVDTLIKGRSRRVCLLKTDKNKHTLLRSAYRMGTGMWREIKRYDLGMQPIKFRVGYNF